jgi:hypothetical protein
MDVRPPPLALCAAHPVCAGLPVGTVLPVSSGVRSVAEGDAAGRGACSAHWIRFQQLVICSIYYSNLAGGCGLAQLVAKCSI